MLADALDSIIELQLPDQINFRLMICDNDAQGSAREVVDRYRSAIPIPIDYMVEENRGIVFARNRILDEALRQNATYMAFFDDDETVDPQWILAHLACLRQYDAEVSVGQVIYLWPDENNLHVRLRGLLERMNLPNSGDVQPGAGTSNVLYKMNLVKSEGLKFHPEHNLRGGSDQLFFQILHDKGAKIVWCNEALTYEKVPLSRANEKWLFKRRYRYGYNKYFILKNRYGIKKARINAVQFCLKTFSSCIVTSVYLPFANEGFKISWKANWLFAKGVLHGLIGVDYFEYQTIHGS